MTGAWWLLAAAALGAWLTPLLDALVSRWRPVRLANEPPIDNERAPRVTVIFAARNEAERVEAAVHSLLRQDIAGLEVVAVDDRSCDGTAETLRRIARDDARLRVLSVTDLPPGWLGKCYALHLGAQLATGDYLLFTDADVRFAPTCLRRALGLCERRGLDHLAAMPDMELSGFWERNAIGTLSALIFLQTRVWRVGRPGARAHVGIGAFNLMRTDAYRRCGGHAAIPMAVTDDMQLARQLKRTGARSDLAMAEGLVSVRWLGDRGSLAASIEKNAYAHLRFHPFLAVGAAVTTLFVAWWPIVGLAVGTTASRLTCAAAFAAMLAVGAWASRTVGGPVLQGIAYPLGACSTAYAILRSLWKVERRGAITWRDTEYRLRDLRAAVRRQATVGWVQPDAVAEPVRHASAPGARRFAPPAPVPAESRATPDPMSACPSNEA
ncbi:MAG TPA: glycosyltransferase family 2 protein [Chthonomonadales bacterium]|nr:glycosyltransferase family 2 protein [Chthonomonadales bacterium]